MSIETYFTKIKPHLNPDGTQCLSEDGAQLFKIRTQSDVVEIIKTRKEFKDELVKKGRLLQPIKWAARIGSIAGATYIFASIIGIPLPSPSRQDIPPSVDLLVAGSFLWLASRTIRDNIEINLSKWESRKRVFERTFHEEISLIPERFHPRRLLGRSK